MAKGLSTEQLQSYRTEGYVVVESLFDAKALAEVNRAIQELTDKAVANPTEMAKILELEPDAVDGQRVARRVFNPFDQHDAFRNLATNERLLDAIESIIGPDINLQHSKLNMKPAKVGSVVDWHQDLAYFPHTNDDLVTTLVYLDDATVENGCLQVIPRHHYAFFNHMDADGNFVGMITEDLSGDKYGRSVPLPAPAGSAIFMHCMLPHSSLPNLSPKPRRTLIFEYRAADSFPIYYGKMTAVAEAQVRILRGQPAKFARFGGPKPLIPRVEEYSSLYDLQGKAKQKAAAMMG
jgi:phytanoyl-CoA hydroxylase